MSDNLPVPSPNPGQFQKGISGNPAGWPRGARNRATLAAEALLDDEAEQLTRHAVDQVLGGDPYALRLRLERILPVLRSRRVRLDLPESGGAAAGAEEVAASLDATLRTMAEGEITPEEALTISGILDLRRRAVE